MVKIAIIYKDIEFIRNLEETLHNRIKETIDLDLSVELLLEEFHEKYVFPRDCDEFLLLCSVDTDVDFSKIPEGCIIIPISQKGKNVESTGSNLQKINAFEYDDKNHSVSVDTLCDIILDKLGIIKNSRKIFISYKRSETKRLAEMVRKELSDAGYTVFLDTRDIDVGSDFMQEIRQSIVESDIFLMLNSESYYDSLYTKKELYAACISGASIVVLSSRNTRNEELNGLDFVKIDEYNGKSKKRRLSKKDRDSIFNKIGLVRLQLWKKRHQRLNRHIESFQERDVFLQGVYVPSKSSIDHSSIYAITGLPDTMDFQRIQQHGIRSYNRKQKKEQSKKLYALFDDLTLPASYTKHLKWLDKEMPNINLIKTSSFEQDISKITKYTDEMNNRQPIVFLSASIPNEDDDDYNYLKIHDMIVTLTETVIKRGGTLVFGGHPTITPIILNIMEIMAENNYEGVKDYPNIYLYQSKFFENMFPPETMAFPEKRLERVPVVAVNDDRLVQSEKELKEKQLSLDLMRERMIEAFPYTSAFFIGGRYKGKGVESSGVWDEYVKFTNKHPDTKCFYIENTGIVPLKLYEHFGGDKFEKILVEDIPSKL